ncbi:MAG: carboxy terminal-processing peptidase [Deltaproteobacteria bacterium]|jgi:carboxyl-terminal processing protease|nr:carboxy terminal-processing peptidase [Deltaproteobacteria bacterium]
MTRRKRWFRAILVSVTLLLAGLFFLPAPMNATTPDDLDENRARLLTYVLRRQVENHFSGKNLDDNLSRAAFQLYVKQLDYQKRLLLAAEVDQLEVFADKIDDEIQSGRIVLAPQAFQLLGNSVERAEKLVEKALAAPFDFTVAEIYETDPEKLEFCVTEAELAERWRTDLKYRTLTRYLNLLEDAEVKDPLNVSAELQQEKELEAREKVRKQYHQYFERLKKETLKEHYDRYLNAFARAFDPHTTYMAPQSKEDFDIGMRGSLEGIGATLREEDGYTKVVKVIPGSAADRQGQLQADDVILAVGQVDDEPVDVTDMRLRDTVALIRGKKGTEVRLTIRRPGIKNLVIPIVRDVVIIEESFVKSTMVTDPDTGNRYGYIKVPSFYRDFESTRNGGKGRNSTDDVRKAIEAFDVKQMTGLILDLRNNGGGALTDAVGIAGLFIGEGPVVQVRNGDGGSKVLRNYSKEVAYHGPLVVMVNQFSASASEIVAGALQDYGRAVIVGSEHTHGKGTVQVIMDLDDSLTLRNMRQYMPLGALKITTQKFYRVSGDSTQYRGVVPDIILPDRSQYNEYGERYLDYSLPWDRIEEVEHKEWPSFDRKALNAKSHDRVAASEEFAEIQRLADAIGERIKDTHQSLLINDVVKEREDLQGADSQHAMVGIEEKDDEPADDEAELEKQSPAEKLLAAVLKDAYVKESMAILVDLAEQRTEIAGKSNK